MLTPASPRASAYLSPTALLTLTPEHHTTMLDCYSFPHPHSHILPPPRPSSRSTMHPKPPFLHSSTAPNAAGIPFAAASSSHTPQQRTRASSSRTPFTPMSSIPSSSSSSSSAHASHNHQNGGPSASVPAKRPKPPRKAHSSTSAKQRGVQASLEAKVEKCRGWQAFFLPAKPVPAGPPGSPVLGASRPNTTIPHCGERMIGETFDGMDLGEDSDLSRSTSNSSCHHPQNHCAMGLPQGFGTEAMQLQAWTQEQRHQQFQQQQGVVGQKDYFGAGWKRREEWVEDVDVDVEAMDLDMA